MKVAYIILGTFNSGGMERILSNKTNYLARQGHSITIITSDQAGLPPFFNFDSRIRHVDLAINFTASRDLGFVQKTLTYFKKQRLFKKRVSDLLFANSFDVVISMFGAEVHWLPRLKDGSKKVAEIHFSKYFRTQQARKGLWVISDWYRSRLDENAISKYDRFVVLTNEDKEYWGDLANISVIYNSCHIEPKAIAHLRNKQAIAVGRLTFQKGYNYMIDTWGIVAAKHPDWVLNIYGSGEDRQKITEQIESLNLTDKIIINDPIQNIETKLAESSIYLLTSRYEGLPMVMLESMACGVPCVAFECKCGPRDVISDGIDGFLVADGNIDAMAQRICTLIENQEIRQQMGAHAVEKIASKFSVDIVMNQWNELFKSLIK